jgi:UDP-N-acetylglucosamine--N-acetylmuramyl-(pentapeptide) pyrophosphoryl-undecaprenol N-acetylglucosamine transferase
VRESIAVLPPPAERFAGRSGTLRLLVLGGSQGARALNQLVPKALALLAADERPDIWHQAGGQLREAAEAAYREARIAVRLTAFIEDMAEAYGWADLVLCRAGALTIAELAATGVGALLVPFPFAVDDHQTANARFLEQGGAARIVQQAELSPERLATILRDLLGDRARLLRMAEAARTLAQTEAVEQVARTCLEQARL